MMPPDSPSQAPPGGGKGTPADTATGALRPGAREGSLPGCGVDPAQPPLAMLIAVTAVGPLALNIFIPSMPGIARLMEVGYGVVQLTLTLYLFAIAIAQLFIGSLSDRFGRRPVLLAGLGLFVAGSVMCAIAPDITTLIVGRIVQAIGGSAGLVLSRAIARDIHGHRGATRMVAYITMAMVVVPMVAPAIGGVLDVWFGWRSIFVLVTMVGVLASLGALRWLHETHFTLRPMPGLGGLLANYGKLMRSPCFVGYAFTAAFSSGIFFAFLAGAPYIVVEILGRPPSEYGFYFVMVSAGYMLGNYLAARLSASVGPSRMLIVATVMAVFGTGILWLFSTWGTLSSVALFGPMAFIAIANGLSLPNAMVGAVNVDPGMAGTASGLAGFFQMSIGGLGTVIVGALQADDAIAMISVMTASALLALAFLQIALWAPRASGQGPV